MKRQFTEGRYYKEFGTYLGTRIVHSPDKSSANYHLFSTGEYDGGGAVKLIRLKA
jgi:hypothetical protein